MLKHLEDQWVGIISAMWDNGRKIILSRAIGMVSIFVAGHMGYLTSEYFFIRQFNSQRNVGKLGCRANSRLQIWHRANSQSSLRDLLILICLEVSIYYCSDY